MKRNITSLLSISSFKLRKEQIKTICFLKNQFWNFGIKSQLNWFKKNIKKNDKHNLLYVDKKLAGYTCLRIRTCFIKNKKKTKYILFDTLIIDKEYRGKKLSKILMKFNNKVIKKNGYFSILVCKKKLLNFYKKNKWKILNKKQVKFIDYTLNSNCMIFNSNKLSGKSYYLFIKK